MTKEPARYNDPSFPTETFAEIKERLSPELLNVICTVSGIESDNEELRQQLAKVLVRYQSAAQSAAIPLEKTQQREFQSLQKSALRFLKTIDALSAANQSQIDQEILYRPPFDSRFYFPQQIDYWKANETSVKRAKDLASRILWASEKVSQKTAAEREAFKPTKNTPLDHLIQDLAMDFEGRTDERASRHCYYNANRENYTGQFFDFVVFILDHFASTSYHSQVALGKRIVRVLALMA